MIHFNANLAAGRVEMFLKNAPMETFAAGTLALVGLTATSVFLWRRTSRPGADPGGRWFRARRSVQEEMG
ncbi:MAG: hypothetical protein IPL30_10090 [Elusimicrobia bacterium]|nr:hypothetical protein [Elusimicrobiota bacterium]